MSELFYQSIEQNITSKEEFDNLLEFINNITERDFIENRFTIRRARGKEIKFGEMKLHLFVENYPLILFLEREKYNIEIKITHKQRVVGVQAMVYICIPLIYFENKNNFLGRKAKKKEHLTLSIEKVNFLIPAMKIFAVASFQHNLDIKNILKRICDTDIFTK